MDDRYKQIIVRYFEGTISESDELHLLEWLKSSPEAVEQFNDFQKIWGMTEVVTPSNNKVIDKDWKLLQQKVHTLKTEEKKQVTTILYWLPRFAAVFILGVIISAAISYSMMHSSSKDLSYYEISAPYDARSEILLPDGTTIWLNAGTHLRYSNEYGRKQREVFLSGEACFNVETHPKAPFLVRTADLRIKAYGTTFNVKSYPEENTVETTLIEGSIGITRNKYEENPVDEVMLEPNQRVVYYKTSQNPSYLVSKGIDPLKSTLWKEGTLSVNSETLGEMAIKLERKYGVKIHFENEALKELTFTGTFENETIEQVLEAIGMAAHLNYEIDNGIVRLKRK
ncbi:MAG: FecR domain-containing protein [Bacteroidota bacterium]